MTYERYHKSLIAPPGGCNFNLAPHIKPELYWDALIEMMCKDGVVMPTPAYEPSGTPTGLPDIITRIYCFVQNTTTSWFILTTSAKVYTIIPSTNTKTDITGAAVLTGGTLWSFATFNGVLYMSNATDGLYKWTGAGNIAAIATAPKCNFIAFFHEHLVGLGDGADRKVINWCNEFDDATWIPATTNDAGGFSFTDTDDNVCAYILGDNLIIYRRNNISMISFIGGDLVYLHKPIVEGAGTISPDSVLRLAGRHIVMGYDFFFEYRGGDSVDRSIGEAINPIIYQGLKFTAIIALGNNNTVLDIPRHNLAIWFYTAGSDTFLVTYNYETNIWNNPSLFSSADVVCALNHTTSFLYRNYVSKENELVLFSPDNIDSITASKDCFAVTGDYFLGSGATDDNGNVVNFPPGTMFTIESVDIEFSFVRTPNTSLPSTIQIGYRNDLSTSIIYVTNSLGVIHALDAVNSQRLHWPIRVTGRWFRLYFTVPDHTNLSIVGFQFNFFPNGNR